jgi:hypothetical protein
MALSQPAHLRVTLAVGRFEYRKRICMSTSTFYRLALLLPYLSLVLGYFLSKGFGPTLPGPLNLQSWGMIWMGLGVFWVIPYTILALGLFIWSIGKSGSRIKSWFLRSPLVMMIVAPIVFALLAAYGLNSPDPNIKGFVGSLSGFAVFFSIPFSLSVGYLFVAFTLVLDGIFVKAGFLKSEL